MHKFRLETWSSCSYLLESYCGTWVVTSKSKKNRSTSNQVGNTFQTLLFTDFATDTQNSVKHYRAACFRAVVPNRSAVAPYGAICNTQGCRELILFLIYRKKYYFQNVIKHQSKLLRVRHWVPQIIFVFCRVPLA